MNPSPAPVPRRLNPFGKARVFFNRGELGAGLAALALGLDDMAARALTEDVQRRLERCAQAAEAFALEWSGLSDKAARRLLALQGDRRRAAWVHCPDCEEYVCMIHLQHVFECACPPIQRWTVNPYVEGRPARRVFQRVG